MDDGCAQLWGAAPACPRLLLLQETLGTLLVGCVQVYGALLGDTGSWIVPIVPAMLTHHVCTGASALGSDFICNLSFKRSLGEPQVRARGAVGFFGLMWMLGLFWL